MVSGLQQLMESIKGTQALRDASRDLVDAFISRLAEEAAKDRAALVCKLNSYCQPEEMRP